MEIKEKAKEYAEGKALSAITTAIEEAYATGYQDGYADGYANRKKPETPIKYNKVSYIDLELPSGTQWATNYLTKTNGEMELLGFGKAINFVIPTIKQFQELLDNTEQFMTEKDGLLGTEFLSKINGARFWLPNGRYTYRGLCYQDNYIFWLKDAKNNGKYALGPTINTFAKYAIPVLLVSKCETYEE